MNLSGMLAGHRRVVPERPRAPMRAMPVARLTMSGAPWLAGSLALGVGSVVLLGWMLGIESLKSMVPGVLTMKANTAICFALLGAGLIVHAAEPEDATRRPIGMALLWATVVIAVLTGAQYITGLDFGIDQVLFREPVGQIGTVVPGRMAPATVVGFVALALATILGTRSRGVVIALCLGAASLSYLNVLDYLFQAEVPAFLAGSTQMAINTAVTMAILSMGVLASLRTASPFGLLAGSSTTEILLRRLLVLAVIVPLGVAWLRLEGQRLGLYDTSFGLSLMVVGITLFSVIAIGHSARWASRMEQARVSAEVERDELFDLSPDLLAVFGADGRFRRVNRAWETILGYPPEELIGRPLFELIHPDDLQRTLVAANRHFGEGEAVEAFQNRYRHRDGSYRWLEWMSRMRADNAVAFAVAREITQRKATEESGLRRQSLLESQNETLSDRALRDALTGLYNRRHFDASLPRLERRWRRTPTARRLPVSLILFDLDHFGQLNKLHGHQAGDAVLRTFAAILKRRIRESDLIARYGGEEFVAILEGATSADAVRIADQVRVAFARSFPTDEDAGSVRTTVSAGCAQLGDDLDVMAALSVADVWLSQAKRAGRNQVVGL